MGIAFIDEIKKAALELIESLKPKPIDPSLFQHPLAMKTEWTPLKPGGASFKTSVLNKVSNSRLEYRASKGAVAFAFAFLGFGTAICSLVLWTHFRSGSVKDLVTLLPLVVPVIFIFFGLVTLVSFRKKTYFDLGSGSYGKGSEENPEKICMLHEIAALQILSEHIRGNKSSYTSYELNLVLSDGKRINVIDHGKLEAVREDARTLVQFMARNIPIWDGTLPEYRATVRPEKVR
jgi:hypothetical protein